MDLKDNSDDAIRINEEFGSELLRFADQLAARMRIGCSGDDLYQDLIVKALEGRFAARERLDRAYLMRSLHNLACDRLKAAQAAKRTVPEGERRRLATSGRNLTSLSTTARRAFVLEQLMQNLSEAEWLAIEYVVVNGCTYAESARSFGCDEKTVKNRVVSGIAALKKLADGSPYLRRLTNKSLSPDELAICLQELNHA